MSDFKVTLEAMTPDPERLIERAARTCYLSWHRDNPPASTADIIRRCIQHRHYSVLEHATASFRISGCSRVMTHELVRHRLASYSQESQRYVCYADKPDRKKTVDFTYVTPPSVQMLGRTGDSLYAYVEFENLCLAAYQVYERLLVAGIPPEDARYVLPNATVSRIVDTMNFRELRHFFQVRTNPRAHWEIRNVAVAMLGIMIERAPNVFYDFHIASDGMSARCIDEEGKDRADGD